MITRSVLFSLKWTRKRLAAGLRPDPLGELKRSPRPPSRINGLGPPGREGMGREGKRKGGGEGKGREGKGKEGRVHPPPQCSLAVDATGCFRRRSCRSEVCRTDEGVSWRFQWINLAPSDTSGCWSKSVTSFRSRLTLQTVSLRTTRNWLVRDYTNAALWVGKMWGVNKSLAVVCKLRNLHL